jgi:hypothetical protein
MSAVCVLPARVARISKKISGVRPGRRTISSFRPSTFCASTQLAALRATVSSKPWRAQSPSKPGDLAGISM